MQFTYKLKHAATSRILVNPAVIPILKTTVNLCLFFVSIGLNICYTIALSDKIKYHYLMCYFKFGLITNIYPNLG